MKTLLVPYSHTNTPRCPVPFLPVVGVESGDTDPIVDCGMDEFIAADVDPHMVLHESGLEKDEVAGQEVVLLDLGSDLNQFFHGAGQADAEGRSIHPDDKTGAVHTPGTHAA